MMIFVTSCMMAISTGFFETTHLALELQSAKSLPDACQHLSDLRNVEVINLTHLSGFRPLQIDPKGGLYMITGDRNGISYVIHLSISKEIDRKSIASIIAKNHPNPLAFTDIKVIDATCNRVERK